MASDGASFWPSSQDTQQRYVIVALGIVITVVLWDGVVSLGLIVGQTAHKSLTKNIGDVYP